MLNMLEKVFVANSIVLQWAYSILLQKSLWELTYFLKRIVLAHDWLNVKSHYKKPSRASSCHTVVKLLCLCYVATVNLKTISG